MSNLTDYGETQVLNHLLRDSTFAKPNTGAGIYLMGLTTAANDDGTGLVEASHAGSQRLLIAQADAEWTRTPDTNGVVCNSVNDRSLGTPTAAGPDLVGWGISDAATGGNIIFAGLLGPAGSPQTVSVVSGTEILIPAANLTISCSSVNQRWCDDLWFDIIDHILRSSTWSKPGSLEMALCTTLHNKAGGGGVFYSGNDYADAPCGPNATLWAAPVQNGTTGRADCTNDAEFSNDTPSADWTGIAGQVMKSGSKILMRQPFADAPRTYVSGRKARVAPGAMTVGLG